MAKVDRDCICASVYVALSIINTSNFLGKTMDVGFAIANIDEFLAAAAARTSFAVIPSRMPYLYVDKPKLNSIIDSNITTFTLKRKPGNFVFAIKL
jgi:hypothetical protein